MQELARGREPFSNELVLVSGEDGRDRAGVAVLLDGVDDELVEVGKMLHWRVPTPCASLWGVRAAKRSRGGVGGIDG